MEFEIGIKRQIFNKKLKEKIIEKSFTMAILAKKTGINYGYLSQIINFRRCPSEQQMIDIAVALEVPIEDIFPEKYELIYNKLSGASRETSIEIETLSLESAEALRIEAPQTIEVESDISKLLDTLTPKEKRILEMRNGFDSSSPQTYDEVGKEFGVTRERIRQIEQKALEKLRQSKICPRNYNESKK